MKRWLKACLLLAILLCCGLDCEAAEKKIEIGKAALDMLYMGDPPSSVKEAVERIVEPRKKFCLVEKVWDKKKEKWVYREVKRK
jgi:hypothetical protein